MFRIKVSDTEWVQYVTYDELILTTDESKAGTFSAEGAQTARVLVEMHRRESAS